MPPLLCCFNILKQEEDWYIRQLALCLVLAPHSSPLHSTHYPILISVNKLNLNSSLSGTRRQDNWQLPLCPTRRLWIHEFHHGWCLRYLHHRYTHSNYHYAQHPHSPAAIPHSEPTRTLQYRICNADREYCYHTYCIHCICTVEFPIFHRMVYELCSAVRRFLESRKSNRWRTASWMGVHHKDYILFQLQF